MADDVVIGSASVQIVGDYSGLEKSFTESQSLAQQAGTKIAAAFEQSSAGASALGAAAQGLSTSIEDLATKSGLAGGELAIFRAALQGSLDAGVPVNQALQDIASSAASLGTAVAGAAQALSQEQAAAGGTTESNDRAADSFKKVRSEAEAFEKAWSEAIQENVRRSNAEFQQFADDVGNFISHPLQSAGNAVRGFILELGPMGVAALAGAAALAAVGLELFSLVKEFGATAEATQNMADRLNLTWTETRNLEEMAQIAGVSLNSLQSASFRLAEALDESSKQGQKIAKSLADIGVAGDTSGELLKGFLEKLAQIPDDTKRIALAHDVLGKSSQQILPLIKNYAELQEAVRSLGPQLDENLAKKLNQADDALDKLSISWNRFKQSIAAFAAPAVQGFVDVLTNFINGGAVKSLDQQIAEIEAKMVSLGEKSALAGWLMSDGMTKGKEATLAALKAQRDLLVGQEQAIERSRQYNEEIAKSNAAAKAASQPGLVQAIIDKQKELSDAVTAARNAYNTLNQAYQTGTALASGHVVTLGEVQRALANVKAAEAAAATTKADHIEKTKALTNALPPLAERTQVWVDQIKSATTEHTKLIAEAAKLGDVIGRYVTAAEMAAIKSAALATSLRVANEGFEDGAPAIVSYMGHAEQVAPIMKDIADAINQAKQEALDTDPYRKLEEALLTLGIKNAQYYKDLADSADEAYKVVVESADSTYEETAQAALIAAEAEIRAALSVGEITRDEADKTLAQIQSDLDKLDVAHAGSVEKRGRRERTLGDDIQAINKSTFNSLERDLARTIVNLGSFSDLWKTLWKKLAEDLLNIMFKVLLDPLEKQIGKVLGGIFGGGSSAASTAAGGAASAGGAAASAGGSVASTAGGLLGSLGSIASIANLGVNIASGIVTGMQQAHMSSDLQKIEESTRYLKIGLVTQGDSLLNDSHEIRNTLSDFMKYNWGVQATYFQGISEKLDTLISFGSGPHSQTVTAKAVSTFATEKQAGQDNSQNITVNIDNVEAGVSDTKVRDIFNRGIRMSKLAGALPAGRFPQ